MTGKANVAGPGVVILVLTLGLPLAAGEPAERAGKATGKAPPGAAKDGAGWKALFDGKTLDGWKSTDFGGRGKVYVKDGAVVMEAGNDMTGITYRRGDFPKTDYEVALEGKKIDGDDFFCTTTFPVGDSFCSFVVGGWGGSVVGLSSIDFMDASMNETSQSKEFKPGRWYRVRVRVTRDRIRAWIDNEKLVDLDTTDKKISLRIECGPCKPFGVATWRTTGAVRNVRVRALTEAEKRAAGGTKAREKE
jgi:hypothetical protein